MNFGKKAALTSLFAVFTVSSGVFAEPPEHAKGKGKKGSTTIAAVPATYQTTCYNFETNAKETCGPEHLSQDGYLQPGEVVPVPRFTVNVNPEDDDGGTTGIADNGICDGDETCNGTALDNLTGLTWLLNDTCPPIGSVNWVLAFELIEELNELGTMYGSDCGDISNVEAIVPTHQSDWRMPSVREMFSLIVHNENDSGWLFPSDHPFARIGSTYNTSTTDPADQSYFLNVNTYYGGVGHGPKANSGSSLLAVRTTK